MRSLSESLILPPRLLLHDQVVKPTARNELSWQRMPDDAIMAIPSDLTTAYERRLARIGSELSSYRDKLDRGTKNPENVLRETMKHLFHCTVVIIKNRKEGVLFHGEHMEQYVEKAFQEAKGFRHWLYADHIPENLHQAFGVPEELKMARSFQDAAKYLALDQTSLHDLSRSAQSDVFQHDLWSLLQLTYLYGLVDLATDPEDEKLLDEFVRHEASTFLGFEDHMSLSVQLDQNGFPIVRRMSWIHRDNNLTTALAENRERIAIIPLTVRKISNDPGNMVVLDYRGKKRYPEMLKILRGREIPVKDKSGVRFILMDFKQHDAFISKLRYDFPGWIFELDTGKPTEESALEYAVKYIAYKQDDPHHKVEIQIDWLTNNGLFQGSYIPKMFQRGVTHDEYRIKQLLKIFPRIFPKELYGLDWENPDVRRYLLQFAYSKATGLPSDKFAPYEL